MSKLARALESKKASAIEAELDKLGKNLKVKGKQVQWVPPADLEPNLARAIKLSVDALGKKVKKGDASVDAKGGVTLRGSR